MEDKGLVDELALLSEADAIFMPNATETLTRFLKDKDNKPEDAIRALSTGFRGYAEMCNLLATWAEESGGCTAEEISGLMVKTVANKIKQVFFFLFVRFFFSSSSFVFLFAKVYDPQCTRGVFQTRSRNIPWMNFMVTKPLWRSVLYELAEVHKADAVLGLALSKIEELGHQVRKGGDKCSFFLKERGEKKRMSLRRFCLGFVCSIRRWCSR
jgi:hypothetical protein